MSTAPTWSVPEGSYHAQSEIRPEVVVPGLADLARADD